jgi:hypothetical protein
MCVVIYMAVCNARLFIANSNTIKIIDIDFLLEEAGTTELSPDPSDLTKVATYQI